ncbi:MAG: hypothetical protein ACFFB0_13385 [Promethearchaeota archaeon]
MNKVSSGIRLLTLFSIFFIYKAIAGIFENNTNEVILWSLIAVIYMISLVILYFVVKNWEKEQKI